MACRSDCRSTCRHAGFDVVEGHPGNIRLTPRALRQFTGSLASRHDSPHAKAHIKHKRIAVCLTGQIRALPLVFMNWQQGPIGRLLKAGGMQLDLFVVTSNTSSLLYWQRFIDSLQPAGMAIVSKYVLGWFPRSRLPAWSFQEAGGVVTFNPAVFPKFVDHKIATALIQHWQMSKCADLIRRREQVNGELYMRVARLRTDVLYGGMLPGLANVAFARYFACTHQAGMEDASCAQSLQMQWTPASELCERRLKNTAIETPTQQWYVSSDFLIFGSRDVVIDGLFRGMQVLPEAKTAGVNSFRNLMYAWRIIRTKALGHNISKASTSASVNGHFRSSACLAAVGAADVVRMAGPPVSRFFLQHSESKIYQMTQNESRKQPTSKSLLPFCEELIGLSACLRLLWNLPLWAIGDCLWLRYDNENLSSVLKTARMSDRQAAVEAETRRGIAHARSFGSQLIGDGSPTGPIGSSGTLRRTGGGLFARRQRNDGFHR